MPEAADFQDQESDDKIKERQLLLRRIFDDDRILLDIGKAIGDEYCAMFNEIGWNVNYGPFNREEVAKRLAYKLNDEQLLTITEKYREKLKDNVLFRGRYYTYDPSEKKVIIGSVWDKIREELQNLYENVGEPLYGILKAFLELNRDWTFSAICKYNPLLYRAEELIGTPKGLRKALDGLQAKNIMDLYKGDLFIDSELLPLISDFVEELEELRKIEQVSPAFNQEVTEITKDLFNTVIGYDDVKELLLMSLESKKPTHILLVGPPASAKTVILLEISKLKGAFYLLGGATTKVGLTDQLFNLRPKYVLLDEIDKMDKKDYTVLLSLMETGIVKEVKHGKTREMVLPVNVYAACNNEKRLPPEVLSRFHFKLYFSPYTKDEFIEVSKRVLMMREGLNEELSTYISNKVADLSRDVRECIGIARLVQKGNETNVAEAKRTVDYLIEVKKKYSPKNISNK